MKKIAKIDGNFFVVKFGKVFHDCGFFSRAFAIVRPASKVEINALVSNGGIESNHTSWQMLPTWSLQNGSFQWERLA
jgi:hypothetical protein